MMTLASYRTLFLRRPPRRWSHDDQSRSRVSMDDIGMRRERLEAMVAEQQQPAKKFACLVDAENTQPSKLAAIMDELNGYGQVAVRRLFESESAPLDKNCQ